MPERRPWIQAAADPQVGENLLGLAWRSPASGGQVEPASHRLVARALAEGGDDPARCRAALYRLCGEEL